MKINYWHIAVAVSLGVPALIFGAGVHAVHAQDNAKHIVELRREYVNGEVFSRYHDEDSGVEFICGYGGYGSRSCFLTGRKW